MSVPSPTHRIVEAVWKIEGPRLVAALMRTVRDLATAEELAQDTFVAALQQWPDSGVPENPGAWLMTAAKHRAIDAIRRQRRSALAHDTLAHQQRAAIPPTPADHAAASLDTVVEDDLLRLVFMTCHPVLAADARAAITLRLLCGLTTAEIARAFLVPEPTVAQRIVRAKKTLAENAVPFELPRPADLHDRLASVLEVMYLLFNEGYAATAGDDWMRPALCDEALRLARTLAALMPEEPEVHALLALMELHASRTKARTAPDGSPILLLDQDRALWDQLLIRRGLASLDTALRLADDPGPYTLQASIAAHHARAHTPDQTDWHAIANDYARLARLTPSPIIELNRAVAIAMAHGPQAGLDLADSLQSNPTLAEYHLLPSVRADLLLKLERFAEARAEFERAASLTRNARERALLLDRARACMIHP